MNNDIITITDFNNLDSLRESIKTEEHVCIKIKDAVTEITQDEFMSLLNSLIFKASNVLCSNEMIVPYFYIVPSLISVDSSNYYFRLMGNLTVESGELKGVPKSIKTLDGGYYWIPKNVSVIYREHRMSCYNFIYEVLSEIQYLVQDNIRTMHFS